MDLVVRGHSEAHSAPDVVPGLLVLWRSPGIEREPVVVSRVTGTVRRVAAGRIGIRRGDLFAASEAAFVPLPQSRLLDPTPLSAGDGDRNPIRGGDGNSIVRCRSDRTVQAARPSAHVTLYSRMKNQAAAFTFTASGLTTRVI